MISLIMCAKHRYRDSSIYVRCQSEESNIVNFFLQTWKPLDFHTGYRSSEKYCETACQGHANLQKGGDQNIYEA